jgi:hypothetical protein
MLSPRKKSATQNDAQRTVELIDTELDMVAGGDPGFGVGTAFNLGVEGAKNVVHVLVATENAPAQAPPSEDNRSEIGSGSITAGSGNPSNFVGR